LVLLGFLAVLAFLWTTANPYWPYLLRQREMAQDYGVRIRDFPEPARFPLGYFYSVLKPGTSIQEVHQLVAGYEAVFACEARSSEIYYYFSQEDGRGLRFEIQYDGDLKFDSLGREDLNERTISLEGCTPGRLGE
jgi:hypothetical protein